MTLTIGQSFNIFKHKGRVENLENTKPNFLKKKPNNFRDNMSCLLLVFYNSLRVYSSVISYYLGSINLFI